MDLVMSEENNILYLCVCMALSDHKLDKNETTKIIEISKRLNIEFNVHDATDTISKKFRDDLDSAQDYYLGNIKEDKNRRIGKELIKEVAISNGELKDKEVRFLVRTKHAWGYEVFD